MKIININIKDKNVLFSSLNDEVLSEEVGIYIINQCMGVKLNESIMINIDIENEIDENEELQIKKALNTFFKIKIANKKIQDRYSNYFQMILLVFGLIMIFLYYLLLKYNILFLSEILLLIGWVLLWEWVYAIVFTETKRYFEIKRYKQLSKSKIKFVRKIRS